uniref:Uncharacterized protein n=1 Tax=Nesodiprion zhejiangensis nucleopolyhedrovirus TaxID=3135970 RepID=A0AAN0N7S8_9BACU
MTSNNIYGQIFFVDKDNFQLFLCSDKFKPELHRMQKKWSKKKNTDVVTNPNLNGFILFSMLLANRQVKTFYKKLPDKSTVWQEAKKQEPQILVFFHDMSVRLKNSNTYKEDLNTFIQEFIKYVKDNKSESNNTIYNTLHKYLSLKNGVKPNKKHISNKKPMTSKKTSPPKAFASDTSSIHSQEEYSIDEIEI